MAQRVLTILRSLSAQHARSWLRSGIVVVSVAVTLAALFVDGFPPASWKAWLGIKESEPVAAAMIPKRVVPGRVTVTMPKPRGNDSSVSPVPLPLILVSTRVGRNSHEGFAQLGVDATSPQTYSAGAVLANGARLSEVYANYVVLERDGQSVRLYLQGQGGLNVAQSLASLLTVGGAPPAPAIVETHESLTEYIRPSPVFKGSTLIGFQVFPGKDVTAFNAIGLQAGDVIVAINGATVSDASAALTQLRSLVQGSALTVDIRRAGSIRSIALDGSVMVAAAQRHRTPITLPPAPTTTL
jgi:type II secretion system protein C